MKPNPHPIQKELERWIENFLDKPHPLLDGWAPCPFARQAQMQNKIKWVIHESPSWEKAATEIRQETEAFQAECYDITVVCCSTLFPLEKTKIFVEQLRMEFLTRNTYLLMDHPLESEVVNAVRFNQGKYLLFLIQPLNKLVEKSNQLRLSGYYKAWPETYFDEVVTEREKYLKLEKET